MNFIEETLTKDEEIKGIFKLHAIVFIPSYMMILGAFLTLSSAILIPALLIYLIIAGSVLVSIGLFKYLILKSIDMGVTNKRIVFKEGLFSIKNEEIQLSAIETIEINQSILGKILGFGDVKMTGRGASTVLFKNIKHPIEAKKIIGDEI